MSIDVALCPQGFWACLCSGHTICLVRMFLHACAELSMFAAIFLLYVLSLLASWDLTRSHCGISLLHMIPCHNCAVSLSSKHISWLCSCCEDIGKPSYCALLFAERCLLSEVLLWQHMWDLLSEHVESVEFHFFQCGSRLRHRDMPKKWGDKEKSVSW